MNARLWPLAVAGTILLADRLTKSYIQHAVGLYESVPVINGIFRIVHSENPGAAFGMLAEGKPLLRGTVLIGVSTVVLFFVASALWSKTSSFTTPMTRMGLSLILGGATGNLFDRIARGTVTDFLEVYSGSWAFPAFNVADSAITVGAAFLLIDLLRPRRKRVHPHVSETH